MTLQHEKLVLASASAIRRHLLEAAGLTFEVCPADLDEEAIKQAVLKDGSNTRPADIAQILAQTKASVVSERYPHHVVIGSDQVLVHGDQILSKPATKEEALDQLLDLRGRTHELISAIAVASGGEMLWTYDDVARLTMREVSNTFIGTYLAEMGDTVTQTVGGYKLEGLGIHLFDKVDGDYFTILGLPMVPLLDFLRARNEQLA